MKQSSVRSLPMQLTPVLASAGVARRRAAFFLATCRREDLAPDVHLIVAELVTNAVMHGAEPIRLAFDMSDLFRIEVFDGDSRAQDVIVRSAESSVPGGRGLRIVDTLADSWGAFAHDNGKTVWAELQRPTSVDGRPARLTVGRGARAFDDPAKLGH